MGRIQGGGGRGGEGSEECLQLLVEEKHLGQTVQHIERHSCLRVHGMHVSGEAHVLSLRQKMRRWAWDSNLGPGCEGFKSVMPRKDLIFSLMVLTDFSRSLEETQRKHQYS